MAKPSRKIICGTCGGNGKEVSFTGAEFDCRSCGGIGSYYEAATGTEAVVASLRAECDRLMQSNARLLNQLAHDEKVYRANSQSYRDEIAGLRAALSTKGGKP